MPCRSSPSGKRQVISSVTTTEPSGWASMLVCSESARSSAGTIAAGTIAADRPPSDGPPQAPTTSDPVTVPEAAVTTPGGTTAAAAGQGAPRSIPRVSSSPETTAARRRRGSRTSGTSLLAAAAGGDGPVGLTVVLAFAQRVPLVVVLLALGDRDLDLGAPVLEVQRQRDQGVTRLAGGREQLVELAAVQQHLAPAARRVVCPVPVEVLGDVDALEPELVVTVEAGPPVDEGGAPHPQGLDLGAHQDQTRLVGVL